MSVPAKAVTLCRGWDDWAHRVFLSTNEENVEKTLKTMAKQRIIGDTIMGVSGFFILDVASIRGTQAPLGDRQIEQIIIFDRSLRVEHFWHEMMKMIPSSESREKAIVKTIQVLLDNMEYYFRIDGGDLKLRKIVAQMTYTYAMTTLLENIRCNRSWLSDDIRFQRIKNLFIGNRVHFLRLDLTNPLGFEQLSKILLSENHLIDTLYLSNTLEYMSKQVEVDGCSRSLSAIVEKQTLVIDTRPRRNDSVEEPPLEQRIRRINHSPVSELLDRSPDTIRIEMQPKPDSNAPISMQTMPDFDQFEFAYEEPSCAIL